LPKDEFESYTLEKLSSTSIQKEQGACAMSEDKERNENTNIKGVMHLNIWKTCLSWYSDYEENGPIEVENGNLRVRKVMEVHVVEEYKMAELPAN
jgi:hypothetical protein